MTMPSRLLSFVAFVWLILALFSPKSSRAQLLDDFTADSSLNAALWTNSSSLLTNLAADFNSSLVTPILSFDVAGMNYSGVNTNLELAGVQTLATFNPPFTVTTTVSSSVAHGNPYELFLINSNGTQLINVSGNVNPSNGKYFGVWVNYNGSGLPFKNSGNNLYMDPSTNAQYSIRIFVETNGTAAVSLLSSNGVDLGFQTNLAVGTGPFYLILSQREGTPVVSGTNIAIWKNVSVTPLAPAPVIAPVTWTNAAFTLAWSAVVGATYQAQYTTNLSPALWYNLGPVVTATNSLPSAADAPASDPQRFYRVVLMP